MEPVISHVQTQRKEKILNRFNLVSITTTTAFFAKFGQQNLAHPNPIYLSAK